MAGATSRVRAAGSCQCNAAATVLIGTPVSGEASPGCSDAAHPAAAGVGPSPSADALRGQEPAFLPDSLNRSIY